MHHIALRVTGSVLPLTELLVSYYSHCSMFEKVLCIYVHNTVYITVLGLLAVIS